MISDGLIIAMIVSGALSLMGMRYRAKPLIFISSLGWMISALQIYEQTQEFLPLGLLLMLSIGQFMLVKGD